MATVLLLDSDINHRSSLALSLCGQGRRVLILENDAEPLVGIASKVFESDVVLANTIGADELLWRQLEHICKLRGKDGLPPLIICSNRI
jgi:hypothetical protein